ncbi:hypothetical protein [uncultured Sphingomonas sp.]|uniref:hypothetical protein n=1 Tax=uncultured Sphingomonas sp. TaxID=158754 RepID=UPI0035C98433
MKKILVAALLGAGLTACGGTPATNEQAAATDMAETSTREPRRTRGFLRADANDDGIVTRAELGEEADGRFARIDDDRDGTASATELASRQGRGERRGAEDTGSRPVAAITKADYRDRALARFDRRDADKDGRLADEELSPQQ